MTGTNLFCEICSLQFDKRIVYNIHLSFVHNIKKNKEERLTENYEKVKSFEIDSTIKKKGIYKF